MKKIFFALIIAIVLATPGFGQRYGQLEIDILSAHQEYEKALLKGDIEKLRSIYANEYIFTTPKGDLAEKDNVLAELASGKFKLETLREDYERTRGYCDSGIVNLIWIMTGKRDGKPFTSRQRVSIFYVKRGNRWLIAAEHRTPLNDKTDGAPHFIGQLVSNQNMKGERQ